MKKKNNVHDKIMKTNKIIWKYTPVNIRFRVLSFQPPPDLVYSRFFVSLIINFGVFFIRNWGFTLKFAKNTSKKGYFLCI